VTPPPFDRIDAFAARTALIGEDGAVLSYSALIEKADTIAAPLPGRCLVMVVCRNDVDCVAGYVGLSRAGAALLLVHHSLPDNQRAAIEAAFKPAFLYAPGPDGYALTPTGHDAPELHPDLALLLTTSGTTGSRNFVRLSYRNLQSNADAIIEALGIGPEDRAITTMPLSYTYGLSILHTHLRAGGSLILTEATLVSPGFWAALKTHQATGFGGVPFIYDMLLKLRFERMDLPHLKTLTQAGGALGAEKTARMVEICAAKGLRFISMYGQTEATARISYVPWARAAEKAGSIGIAVPGGRISLDEADGELIYEGPNVSMGYAAGHADLSRGDENGGRLRTGDLAAVDPDGFYRIVGRKKRFLKIAGHRVNLDEIEHMLRAAGHDAACSGEDDRLEIHAAGGADPEALRREVAERTGLNPNSLAAFAVEAIPVTESGKVDYARLRALSAGR